MAQTGLAALAPGRKRSLGPAIDRLPPHAYFAVSAVFHYLGPAFAVLLFSRVDVLGVAWLRISTAAVIFALWRRPWRVWRESDGGTRRVLVGWGAVLAVMNSCFYLAIGRLPLGTVAAIEFLPVIALAALAARTKRNGVALLLAVPGVYLLTDVRLAGEPVGVAFAAANAVLFALYIILGHRVAQSDLIGGIDGLALAMLVAAVVAFPIGIWGAAPAFTDPVALAAAVGVGVCSSVVPYVCDQSAMARLTRATYALMVSLFPGHCHRHRRCRPHPGAHPDRDHRRCSCHRWRSHPQRPVKRRSARRSCRPGPYRRGPPTPR
jgi:inner membrane transporter RhtA